MASTQNYLQPVFLWLSGASKRGKALATDQLFNLTAEQIAQLWHYRWTIEIVFRWLKLQLKLDHLIAYSINGMLIQVAVALIVYGLLVLYNQDIIFSPARVLLQIQQEFEEAI